VAGVGNNCRGSVVVNCINAVLAKHSSNQLAGETLSESTDGILRAWREFTGNGNFAQSTIEETELRIELAMQGGVIFGTEEFARDFLMTQADVRKQRSRVVQLAFSGGLGCRKELISDFGQRAYHNHEPKARPAMDDLDQAPNRNRVLDRSSTKLHDHQVSRTLVLVGLKRCGHCVRLLSRAKKKPTAIFSSGGGFRCFFI
jgi:hypothetical protein